MQVIILGSGPGLPSLDKKQSAILTEIHGENILFDCGEGTSSTFLKMDKDPDFLDSIVISHMHPDHSSGLPMLIQMLYLQNRTKLLSIYTPESPIRFIRLLHDFYLFEDRFNFDLEIKPMSSLPTDYPFISIFKSNHLDGYYEIIQKCKLDNEMNSYSYILNENDRKVVYTSDISTLEHLCDYANKVDTFIVDAVHLPLAELKCILTNDIKRIILSHGISNEIKDFIETNQISGVELAQEGKEIL
ncbi:MAG: ribonuclease Z [Candidatus Zophobacter franzmannii]|nr:ribonuclease Z [Candidatus Zophobacter franzmannii]